MHLLGKFVYAIYLSWRYFRGRMKGRVRQSFVNDSYIINLVVKTVSLFDRLAIGHAALRKLHVLYPFKPSVFFVGHMQTVQAQTRRRTTRRLIRASTVCLQYVLLDYKEKLKTPPNNPQNGNGLFQLIIVKSPFGLNGLIKSRTQ